MKQSDAWFVQASSDRDAAERIFVAEQPETYCQAIAKCQQTVEKGIKSVVAALNEAAVLRVAIGYKHDAERFISALSRLPRKTDNRGIQANIDAWLWEHWRSEVRAIDAVVPRRPLPGQLPNRNTEYPFQTTGDSWRAPAEPGVFLVKDV